LEKEDDKQKAIDGFQFTTCFDLQAILIAPDCGVSSFYYKRRLATYNFTIYNMKNGEGTCYVWNETIANRGANEIGTCLLDFIRNELNGTENNLTDIIFYSDNCSGQNKNKCISKFIFICIISIKYQYNSSQVSNRGPHTKRRRLCIQ